MTRKLRSSQTVAGGPRAERSESDPSVTVGSNFDRARWVSERPAPTIVTTRRSKDGIIVGRQLPDGEGENVGGWGWERPATTLVGSFRPDVVSAPGYRTTESRQNAEGGVRIALHEALILQSFPPDYPLQGSRSKCFEQVGNAVPPVLAMHVLASVLGLAIPTDEDDAA